MLSNEVVEVTQVALEVPTFLLFLSFTFLFLGTLAAVIAFAHFLAGYGGRGDDD